MKQLALLVYNELEKIVHRKRFLVVTITLQVIIPLFVYGQYRTNLAQEKTLGISDWKIALQQSITDSENRLQSTTLPETYKKLGRIQVEKLKYHLENNINPNYPGAPTFVRRFIVNSTDLFLPLLVMIVAIDIISGEKTSGTIKMLLTRPISRSKILTSKYIAMILSISTIFLIVVVTSYLISGLVFGYRGLDAPILTGFNISDDALNTTAVTSIPTWKYLLYSAGLSWFVAITVGTITFMVSTLVRSTAIGIGVIFASLISGTLLKELTENWSGLKYLYSVHLMLPDFLSGTTKTPGFNDLFFSISILAAWASVSLIASYLIFTKKDIV